MEYISAKALLSLKEDVEVKGDKVAKLKAQIRELCGQIANFDRKKYRFEARAAGRKYENKYELMLRCRNVTLEMQREETNLKSSIQRLFENISNVTVKSNGDAFVLVESMKELDKYAQGESDRAAILGNALSANILTDDFYKKLDDFISTKSEYLYGYLCNYEKASSPEFDSFKKPSLNKLFTSSMKMFGNDKNSGYVYKKILSDSGYRDKFFMFEGQNVKQILKEKLPKEHKVYLKEKYNQYRIDIHAKRKIKSHVLNGAGVVIDKAVLVLTSPLTLLSKGLKKLSFVCDYKSTYKEDRSSFKDSLEELLDKYHLGKKGIKSVSASLDREDNYYYLDIAVVKRYKSQKAKIRFYYNLQEGEYRMIEELLGDRKEFNFEKKQESNEDFRIMRYIDEVAIREKASTPEVNVNYKKTKVNSKAKSTRYIKEFVEEDDGFNDELSEEELKQYSEFLNK